MEHETHGPAEQKTWFKILPTGDRANQTVRFADDSDLPDAHGAYRDDGYQYTPAGSERVYTRTITQVPDYDDDPISDNPAYDIAFEVIRDQPTLTYRQFIDAAEQRTKDPERYAYLAGDDDAPYVIDEERRRQAVIRCGQRYFRHAVRFVTKGKAADMRPRAEVPPGWKDFYTPENWKKDWEQEVWEVAFEHMQGRGTSARSPFLSVATNEAALLHSTDWGANSIVFGAPDEGKRASHIAHLRIPTFMLLSPDHYRMDQYLKAKKGDLMPLLLFRRESEQLFLGADLTPYVVYWRDNPYQPEDRESFVGDI
jgi:hypothetical protein